MEPQDWRQEAALSALNRLLPRIEKNHENELVHHAERWIRFKTRLNREWERLFVCLHQLYGWQYDFFIRLNKSLTCSPDTG